MAGWLHLTGPPASSCSILRTGEKDLIPCSLADYLICLNKNLVEKTQNDFILLPNQAKTLFNKLPVLWQRSGTSIIPLSQWCILCIPPILAKFINFPTSILAEFINFPPIFVQFRIFFLNLRCFVSPYLGYDALMLCTYWRPLSEILRHVDTSSDASVLTVNGKKILLFVTFKYCFCLPPKPLGVDSGLDIDMPFVVRPGNP